MEKDGLVWTETKYDPMYHIEKFRPRKMKLKPNPKLKEDLEFIKSFRKD